MGKELLLSSLAFGLFVVCPRMAGMMHVIAGQESLSMMKTVLVGTAFSVPLLMLMVMVFGRFGVWGALTVCVLIMGSVSAKAGVETAVIALFVIMGVKVAPFISKALF